MGVSVGVGARVGGQPQGQLGTEDRRHPHLPGRLGKTDHPVHAIVVRDGQGRHAIHTGVGFFDHMLTHVAVHGLFDLNVEATGDTDVDDHHTVEDVGIALGQALWQAL